jgi:hypothetical protein
MKRALCLFVLALIMAIHFPLGAALRGDLWRQVDEAVQKGLPKTAITNLEPIIAGALKDKAYAEATKAIAKKIVARRQHPRQQTGGKNHPAGGGNGARAQGNAAGAANLAGALVLAVLPAKSLAVHAAHGHGPSAGQGFHDLGFAAPLRGD